MVKKRKELKIVLYFWLLYLIGVFFTAGPHPPLGGLYVFLMKVVPGVTLLRSNVVSVFADEFVTTSTLAA